MPSENTQKSAKSSSTGSEQDGVWESEQSKDLPLAVHKDMLARGLLIVKPKHLSQDDCQPPFALNSITKTSFLLGSRYLKLSSAADDDAHYRARVRATQKAKSAGHKTSTKVSKQEWLLAGVLPSATKGNSKAGSLSNTRRKEEIFFPLKITEYELTLRGPISETTPVSQTVFAYLWTAKMSDNDRYQFDCYVTAGCLFGSNLEGKDRIGNRLPLIKHDREFWPEQIITSISYDASEPNPYEQLLFRQVIMYCKIIKHTHLPNDQPTSLVFHIPSTDYALYGVELFIRGRMDKRALYSLLRHIDRKTKEYETKISSIINRFNGINNTNIQVRFLSPFEAIFNFSDLSLEDPFNPEEVLQSIESKFGSVGENFSLDEFSAIGIDTDEQAEIVKKFVTRCIHILGQNTPHIKAHSVWRDFVGAENSRRTRKGEEPINTLEGLFRIANAVVIGTVTQERKDNAVCSLLPVSEKQIQVEHSRLCKGAKYPPTVNITTLDPVVQFSDEGSNIPFNFSDPRKLCETIDKVMPYDSNERYYLGISSEEEKHTNSSASASASSTSSPENIGISPNPIVSSSASHFSSREGHNKREDIGTADKDGTLHAAAP